MPFLSALTSGQLEALRGENITGSPRFYSTVYLSMSSNLTIFSARVNQLTFASSFADVTYDTVTTGAYTDIEIGMTVYLSATNNKRDAYFIGRIRTTPTDAVLYINETSADVTDNDYIFVCQDHRVHDKLERDAGGVHYKDYDEAYHPPLPVFYGMQSCYAGFVSGTPAGFTVAFSATAFAIASGASTASYAYTLPGSGATVTAGNVNTANVTVRFDESPNEYWVKVEATDSDGNVGVFWIAVWAHGDTYPPATGFEGISITGDLDTGFNASVQGFDGISTLIDGTIVCIWSIDVYNDVQSTINTNIHMCGQFRRDSGGVDADETFASTIQSTELEIEGAGGILSRITSPLLAILNSTNATVWDEIETLTVWRAICHLLQTHSTFLERYSLAFFSTNSDFRLKAIGTQNNSLLATINDMADDINGRIEFAPDGSCRVIRDARYLSSSDRTGLTTVADFDTRDAFSWAIDYEQYDSVGRVEADGGAYNPSSDNVTPLLSLAPGYAQGTGSTVAQLTQQVLVAGSSTATAQTELNQRTGYHYARLNTRFRLSVNLPDGYYFLIPSVRDFYTWLIDSTTNNRGFNFDDTTNWLLESISYTYENGIGSFGNVSAEFSIETTGQAGDTIEYPAINEIPLAIPPIPAFDVYPTFPSLPSLTTPSPTLAPPVQGSPAQPPTPATDGNVVLIGDADGEHVWWTDDYKRTSANNWREVTPSLSSGEVVVGCALGFGTRAYLLTNDSANARSRVWTTSNPFVSNPSWGAGGWVDEEYDIIKATSIQDEIMIQVSNSTDASTSGSFSYNMVDTSPIAFIIGSVNTGQGNPPPCIEGANFPDNSIYPMNGAGDAGVGVFIEITLPSPVDVSNIALNYNFTQSFDTTTGFIIETREYATDTLLTRYTASNAGTADGTWRTKSQAFTDSNVGKVVVGFQRSGPSSPTGTAYLDNVVITYSTTGGGSGNAFTRFSDDNGNTFANIETVGTSSLTTIGFDVIKIGTQALCGRSGGVEINLDVTDSAEDFALYGSALPALATAKCIVIPRYRPNTSSTNNANTDTPQYILASSALSAGGESMWVVDNDGNDFNDITPNNGGNEGLAISPHCVTMPFLKGNKLACILDFNGTRRLYTSGATFGNWNDEQSLGANADYIRMRKSDSFTRELYFVDDFPYLSVDFGVTIAPRSYPDDESTNPCAWIEVYG